MNITLQFLYLQWKGPPFALDRMLNESKCRCGRDVEHRYTLPAKEMELKERPAVCLLTAIPKYGVWLCDRGSKYDQLIEFITSDLDYIYMSQEYTLKKATKSTFEIFILNNVHGIISQKDVIFMASL